MTPEPVQTVEAPKEHPLSLGEYRVGINFNPGNSDKVSTIKTKTAEIINFLKAEMDASPIGGEQARLYAHAMTMFEDAAMWGVKAVTKEPSPL